MNRLTKSEIRHLKTIAASLPPCYTAEQQKTLRLVTGAQMIAAGKETTGDGKEINPKQKYVIQTDEGVRVNHYKRLKTLCENGRYESAQNYINEVAGLNKGHYDLIAGMASITPTL